MTTSGGAKCWGANGFGQLGNGTLTSYTEPVDVNGLGSGIMAIEAGEIHTCARTTSGGAKCWGDNRYGEIGDGTQGINRTEPVDVTGLTSGVYKIVAGGSLNGFDYYSQSCALMASGEIRCWGSNMYGQLGNGTSGGYSTLPVATNFSIVNGYSYDNHAVTSLASGETYTYDENGNMIERLEGGQIYYQTFDAENRMTSVTVNGQTTQFVYDGDGNLVKKIKPGGSSTIYIGNVYEIDKSSGGVVTRTVTYYPAGGAMRIDGSVYYVLKDRLGSAYATTDASGNVIGEMRYYAFGETRLSTGTMFTDRLFTGQRQIADLGIYHYNARFYSPTLGRFLSADTLMSGFANPQSLNRFSYTANNPVRYTDPTGRCWIELSSHMVWFSDSDPKCGGSYNPPSSNGGSSDLPDLPDVETLPNPEGRPLEVQQQTLAYYLEVREILWQQCGSECVDPVTGMIKDEYVTAMIMFEFMGYKGVNNGVYLEGKEAVSNEYYSGADMGYTYYGGMACQGECTIGSQLSWLYDIEFFRSDATVKLITKGAYNEVLEDAKDAIAPGGYSNGVDSSWHWGNITNEQIDDFCITAQASPSLYPGTDLFIVYSCKK